MRLRVLACDDIKIDIIIGLLSTKAFNLLPVLTTHCGSTMLRNMWGRGGSAYGGTKRQRRGKQVSTRHHRWTEGVSRLVTPSAQTPGERAGEPRNTFLNSGNHTGTIWTPDRGNATTAIGLTKMMTSESPRITTWSLSEVKLFVEWCTTHQVFQLENVLAWSVINQCFDQDVITTLETLVCGRRRTEMLERRPLQELPLDEILRYLRSSAPDTGKSYNKSLNVAGNLLQHTSAYILITWKGSPCRRKCDKSWTRALQRSPTTSLPSEMRLRIGRQA